MLSLGQRVCTLAMLIVITKLPPKELDQLLFPQALQACRLITYNLCHVCPGKRGMWSRDFTSFSFSPFQVCVPRRAADERPFGGEPFSLADSPPGRVFSLPPNAYR